jgi:hypothetical protein
MANATLRIWWFTNYENKGFAASEIGLGLITLPFWLVQGRRPQKAFGFGHASLQVPGRYISWGGAASEQDDTANYKIQPETYQIPLMDGDTMFGLKGQAITQWYDNWAQNPSYNLVTRNCCDCVTGALTAGGGLYFSQIGTKWLGYDGARTVSSWGQRIRDKVTEMNANWRACWAAAKPVIERGRASAGRLNTDDLYSVMPQRAAAQLGNQMVELDRVKWTTIPTLAEWKKRSSVLIGYRKEQILKMDQLLEVYDRIRNNDPGLRDMRAFYEKANTLKALVLWASDHIRSKPNSDRKDAVLPLASAAWNEHNRLARENQCSNGRRLEWDLIV